MHDQIAVDRDHEPDLILHVGVCVVVPVELAFQEIVRHDVAQPEHARLAITPFDHEGVEEEQPVGEILHLRLEAALLKVGAEQLRFHPIPEGVHDQIVEEDQAAEFRVQGPEAIMLLDVAKEANDRVDGLTEGRLKSGR